LLGGLINRLVGELILVSLISKLINKEIIINDAMVEWNVRKENGDLAMDLELVKIM
jgi:hypothetical protein